MYSLELLITIGLAALLLGALAGAIIVQRKGTSARHQRQLEARLNELETQSRQYRQEVSEHFVETADLLNQLTSSYRNVHDHLARGAHTLAADSRARETLQDLDAEQAAPDQDDAGLTPPLDYAPRQPDESPGVLHEEYGLDRARRVAGQAAVPGEEK